MGVNKVILLGNLGKDPELRYTAGQTAVCTLNLATGERRKDPSGNWVDHTEWHSVVTFGRTAENCSQYLKKGRQVFVEGRIQTRKWQDKEGRDRYSTEVIASNVQFVGGTGRSSGDARPEKVIESNGASTSSLETPAPEAIESSGAPPEVSFNDDDIPF